MTDQIPADLPLSLKVTSPGDLPGHGKAGPGSVARALELSLLHWGKEVVIVFSVLGTQSDQMSQGNEAIGCGGSGGQTQDWPCGESC